MSFLFWRRYKKQQESLQKPPRVLTGIEKWEMEQEAIRNQKDATEKQESLFRAAARVKQLRAELGEELVELERLESQLSPIFIGPNQILSYPLTASQQQSSLSSFSGLFGSLGGFGSGFSH